ncbi:hypothetical protein BCR42DRAFT_402779 [Absidia repens]|uniref:Uncharacterized protein n=1 Tax=Absidia repens TaxID=90262 RepID=A0A1X2IYM4_9FUNG|nr:hypothetical protein BCR42DRAFT_402779 [Absidia repens]
MIKSISSKSLGPLVLLLLTALFSLTFFYSTTLWQTYDRKSKSAAISQSQGYIANTASSLNSTYTQWEQCLDPGQNPSYYLSIVVVTRMDDYAGGQHHRLQNFIDSAYLLAERTRENIELLIVEWNPPDDRRGVIDAFRFRRSGYLTYRIITVSNKVHHVLPNRGNSPLHEFEGKNVGIRFARGEFVVCTNQDDIWSHNFHNAVQSRVFEKGIIYLQHQDVHNMQLPPSIVRVPPFADDTVLYNSCRLGNQVWGQFSLPTPLDVTTSRGFHLGHRDTWKIPRGYREEGGVAWMDVEFICTAAWTFDLQVVYSEKGFTCHQEHKNVWELNKEQHNDKNISLEDIRDKKIAYVNKENNWALQQLDIWELELGCIEFRGGLNQ